jgi:hypothetical protein
MSSSKISPIIPLVIGVIFIGAALTGIVVSLTRDAPDGDAGSAQKVVVRSQAGKEVQAPVVSAQEKTPSENSIAEILPEVSEEELRRQTVNILLKRIGKTPTNLNAEWLTNTHQFVRDANGLSLFFGEYMQLGEKGSIMLERAQLRSKKILPQDPRYYISQANATVVAKENTEATLLKGIKENLALALYKKKEELEGLENVEPQFMGTFFKKILAMFQMLEEMALKEKKDPDSWMKERVRTLEAAITDRYLRVERRRNFARQKKEGTGNSIAPELFLTDRLEKAINENLLELGRVYYEGAAREFIDREKHQYYADQAFKTLAMVYRRSHSGEALNLMREVNDIQRDYLHSLAKTSWKRAQLAVAAGDVAKADESYYIATQRYLQCMSQAVETHREFMVREFRILKQEIAGWNAKKKSASAVGG